ncbi:MAG: Zn-dependent hydrolase [Oscillospiraceae bacterium]
MKKTYVTHMDDHVGAFLLACKRISALGVNITRVSYNKSIDMHMLFIEVEGTEQQISVVTKKLEEIGYLQDNYRTKKIMLLEFRIQDQPGMVLPILELINQYQFNISYISSQENGSGYQSFKMGLLVEHSDDITAFIQESSKLCDVCILGYDKTERNLDNTVFYLSFANEIADRISLSEQEQTELVINSNLVMQNLDERNSQPYKTFEYIGRFADNLQKYKGKQFHPRMSIHKTRAGLIFYLIEPPCGSNTYILNCGDRYLFIDCGFACYREEQLATICDILPDFKQRPCDAAITHADVDHCGVLDWFETVYLSQKCFDNFQREQIGQPNLREENSLHLPYVKISKILSAYRPPDLGRLQVIGGVSTPQDVALARIGTLDYSPLQFEVYEGMGGHVAGETIFLERTHRIVFTGDIFVNLKDFSMEQAAFNRLAPYLMTSVDSNPAMAAQVRQAVFDLLDEGDWIIAGGHGAILRYNK